jgi:folate-binding protein YgfZ
MTSIAELTDRAVLDVSGEDRVGFLQGLVSNDVAAAVPGRAVWSALLTPQGKWVADFFIFADGERLLLDVEAAQAALVTKLLSRYRLRSKVAIAPTGVAVRAVWGGAPPPGGVQAPDPRLAEAGWRVLGGSLAINADAADYDLHRLRLGLPDGSRDLEAERSTLVESGFDELHGIGWEKGCYMGQELTARTKYRGLVKRRLVPVRVEGALMQGETEVGTIRSGRADRALASLRLEAIRAESLRCGDAVVVPEPASWMRVENLKLASA